MWSTTLLLATLALFLLAGPLAGAWLTGEPLAPYLQFPPTTVRAPHASFSWPVFLGLAATVAAALAPFVSQLLRSTPTARADATQSPATPWWGWLGAVLLAVSWIAAWTRLDALAPLQRHTFTPLWLGYVLVVNALTLRRTGRCMLRDRPRKLVSLFPLSAVFWWLFEFLNRFVRNWYYVDVTGLGPWEYFWQATLPFSTVLPAVLCTKELLHSFPRLRAGLGRAWRVRVPAPRATACGVLAVSGSCLVGIGARPDLLYPMVWVAPLATLLALQVLWRRPTVLAPLAQGDWREIWLAALAALVCGFFWELWNVGSLARWAYAIPYVHRFELFEMPLLGYAGYLPFGVQCLAAGSLLERRQ